MLRLRIKLKQEEGKVVNMMELFLISGYLPIPPNFTTVGKPQIVVNQYDSPLDVYSEDTIEEMKEERLTMQNPEVADRIQEKAQQQPPKPAGGGLTGASDNPLAAMKARQFDPTKSNVLNCI